MVDERFEETSSMRGQSELDFYIRLLCLTNFILCIYFISFVISIVAFLSIPSLWRGHGKGYT
jgi:hypothetical protein